MGAVRHSNAKNARIGEKEATGDLTPSAESPTISSIKTVREHRLQSTGSVILHTTGQGLRRIPHHWTKRWHPSKSSSQGTDIRGTSELDFSRNVPPSAARQETPDRLPTPYEG